MLDSDYSDPFSLWDVSVRAGIPVFAMHSHPAAVVQVGQRNANFSDDALFAGSRFPAPRPDYKSEREDEKG